MPGQQLKKWGYPHVTELHYPVGGIKTTRDRHNWIKGVYLDGRLTERAQHILTRLILYLNLNTQVCNPTLRNLAMMCGMGEDESAVRMVRGALEAGEKLGWIRRHMRFGGSSKYNQSSRIEFLVPDDVTPAGLAGSVKLKVVEQGGKWYVAQVKDGVKICGRFATHEAAETWMMEHGPDWGTDRTLSKPDRIISRPDRTLLRSDRTPESALNTECMNTEYVKTKYGENSVLTYCGSNEPHSHPGCISINGCISDTSKPTPGKRIGTSRGQSEAARNNNSNPAPAADSKIDIEALAEKVRGGTSALMHLRLTGQPKTVGALVHSVRLGNEELDVAAFLKCGAVYREGDLIYPVGWSPSNVAPEFDPSEYPF